MSIEILLVSYMFFFSSRRRHTRCSRDWSSDVCSSDLIPLPMAIAHNLGFPPIGAGRELKRATEGYWGGKVSRDQLLRTGAELRAAHWRLQRDAGLDLVPVNDFSFYDRVLDTCAMVGAVPERYGWSGASVDLDTYFAMARGSQGKGRGGGGGEGGGGGRDSTRMGMQKRCVMK